MTEPLKENEDYELVPEQDDQWAVRILSGPFVETVVQYDTIRLDGKEGCLRYNFEIVSSPDPDLQKENQDFLQHVTNILYALLLQGVEDGSVDFKEQV